MLFYKVVLFLHILFSILWFGGVLFIGSCIFPILRKVDAASARNLLLKVMYYSHPKLVLAGILVILTGTVLGVVIGPIDTISDLWQTDYGVWWSKALIVGILTLGYGSFIGYKQTVSVLTDDLIIHLTNKGHRGLFNQKLFYSFLISSVEGVGFLTLLYLMIFK
ncbi:hypothetical protein [Alkalibacillus aidingensis]|uniref:hypothetical protein n=1 Tax=Alkalibacillus aidingensis TaxID=2747607 RepID=UPI001660C887|nr:hypothetical protein [Alkalibacillus aidingensis]